MLGLVVWLSAPDNHIKPYIPFPPVLDPQRHYETRALYYVNGEILYFNPTLTNACNGNTTLEREGLADLKMEISHQNLQAIWRSSVLGDRKFERLRKIFSKYKPGHSEPFLKGKPSLEVIDASHEKVTALWCINN
jgi:hypothetical protein